MIKGLKECWINVYYYAGHIYGEPRESKRLAHDVSLGTPFKLAYRIHVKLK
jgi:hypothetical protein